MPGVSREPRGRAIRHGGGAVTSKQNLQPKRPKRADFCGRLPPLLNPPATVDVETVSMLALGWMRVGHLRVGRAAVLALSAVRRHLPGPRAAPGARGGEAEVGGRSRHA